MSKRFVRYLNDKSEWEYASVKDVGDLSALKTLNKEDLVSAINSLMDEGIFEIIQPAIDEIGKDLTVITDSIGEQGQIIQEIELSAEEQARQQEALKLLMETAQQDIDQAKAELLVKADVTYVDGQLVKKVDTTQYKAQYDAVIANLLKKVNLEEYQESYARIVEDLSNKADNIDFQNALENLNNDVSEQAVEIDTAKAGIIDMDTKVDSVKSELLETIDAVNADVDALDTKVAKQQTDFINRVGEIEQTASTNLSDAKAEIEASLGTVKDTVTDLNEKVDATKSEVIDKINADVGATNQSLADVLGKVTETELNIADINTDIGNIEDVISATNSKLEDTNESIGIIIEDLDVTKSGLETTKESLSTTQGELGTTKKSLQDTKDLLDSVKDNIVYKVEVVSSNGNVFKSGQIITTLEARVYHGVNDVTDTMNASKFRWTRVSRDSQDDAEWNASHSGGTKSIPVTHADVRVRATFNCELLI